MKWKKYTLTTTTAAEDFVSSILGELGVEGIEIKDNIPLTKEETKGMFIDILPELPPDEGVAWISFYLEPDGDHQELLAQLRRELEELSAFVDVGAAVIEESETKDQDWINNWKEFFKPFVVDEFLIKPTWEEVPKGHEDKILIQIDPGTAFGTGMHETTQLCIRQLKKYVTGDTVLLDIGTGSGILGIAALKLGAREVFGTDLDENAIAAVLENLTANGIGQEQFSVVCGNILADQEIIDWAGPERYDVIVANILAPVILLLQDKVAGHLKPGGIFITSGIIDTKEQQVMDGFLAHPEFKVLEVSHQGEWVSITVQKAGKE